MTNLLFIDGLALIKVWVIGFFVFHLNGIIHILPLISSLAFLLRFLYNRSLIQNNYY
jgi:hypothetical protein